MPNNERVMRRLAEEIIGALSDIQARRLSLSIDVLSRVLSNRPAIMDLVGKASSNEQLQESKAENGLSLNELIAKEKASPKLLEVAGPSDKELVEVFQRLVSTLALLVYDPDNEPLKTELKNLHAANRDLSDIEPLEDVSMALKDLVRQKEVEVRDDSPLTRHPDEPVPEGLEENIRDILMDLVRDITFLEEPEYKKRRKSCPKGSPKPSLWTITSRMSMRYGI